MIRGMDYLKLKKTLRTSFETQLPLKETPQNPKEASEYSEKEKTNKNDKK